MFFSSCRSLRLRLDATPLRDIPLNTIPTIPFDEPLHSTLDRFQQGNSHMAVVSRIPIRTESKTQPGSVMEDAKVGLTRRFLNRVLGDSDSDSSDSDSDSEGHSGKHHHKKGSRPSRSRKKSNDSNTSKGSTKASAKDAKKAKEAAEEEAKRPKPSREQSPKGAPATNWMRMNQLEQTMPSDAILSPAAAEEVSPLSFVALSYRSSH